MLSLLISALSDCNQQNKQKAMYSEFQHIPSLATVPATDVIADITWEDLDDMRAYGNRGNYQAWTLGWRTGPSDGNPNAPGGYMGPQSTGAGDSSVEQVLFSLWDKKEQAGIGKEGWYPALPLIDYADARAQPGTASCKR